MSGARPVIPVPAQTASEVQGGVDADNERSVGQIREEFVRTVAQAKKQFAQMIGACESRIRDLAERLAPGIQETPRGRVLVVDDAESTGEIATRYLEGHPVEVVQVASTQARDRLRSQDYDAIMVEAACVIEPGVDGMALGRQLCADRGLKKIIVMSSRPGDRIRHSVEEAGAVFLRKPFQRAQLVQLVNQPNAGSAKYPDQIHPRKQSENFGQGRAGLREDTPPKEKQ